MEGPIAISEVNKESGFYVGPAIDLQRLTVSFVSAVLFGPVQVWRLYDKENQEVGY